MSDIFKHWMKETLKTTDITEAAVIIWNTYDDTPSVSQHENGLYGAALGKKGHGIGLTEDEAVVQSAWDAYFKPFVRAIDDLLYAKHDQINDINRDFADGKITDEQCQRAIDKIEIIYQQKRAELAQQYPAQAEFLAPKTGDDA